MNDLSRSTVAQREALLEAMTEVLDSGWFLNGPRSEVFSDALAAYVGVRHVVPVGNGTDALEIAIRASMPRGRTAVLVAANAGGYASVATRRAGFDVTFADVSPRTHCLDPQDVAARLTDAVGVVVVTHLYGRAADVEPILTAAHEVGAVVIEDCAQALGAATAGGRVGSLADAATFSFYPTKNLGGLGDGGAIAMDSERLAQSVSRLHQYGWDTKYRVSVDGGRNSRMDELQASLLSRRLPYLDGWNQARRQIIASYVAAAPDGVRVLEAVDASHTGHLAVVEVEDRAALVAHLESKRIRSDVHYPVPDHRQPAYAERLRRVSLPVTEALAGTVLSLPVFPEMSPDEISRVGEALATFRA